MSEEDVRPPPDEPPQEEHEEGAPLWMATFGDMMSLLLVFFILMYSMSELREEEFILASASLNKALGGSSLIAIPDPSGLTENPVFSEMQQQESSPSEVESEGEASGGGWQDTFADAYLDMVSRQLTEFVEENELSEVISVVKEGEGVYLRIETMALFASGEAVMRTEGEDILGYLSLITSEFDVPVSISGHADNVPIRTAQFASNWELSAARAAGVARALVAAGQDPTGVRVESYGEFKPIASNDTPEGRAQNRRVELFYDRDEVRKVALEWATSPAGDVGDEVAADAQSAEPVAGELPAGASPQG